MCVWVGVFVCVRVRVRVVCVFVLMRVCVCVCVCVIVLNVLRIISILGTEPFPGLHDDKVITSAVKCTS